jgi:hypothetical protein
MSPLRYRDHEESSAASTVASVLLGAVAGFAVGMFVAQRVGGFSGLTKRFRHAGKEDETGRQYLGHRDHEEYDEIEDEDEYAGDADDEGEGDEEGSNVPLIEERVLEAFNNDPILSERAVDIGAIGRGTIELAGWVETDDEAEHATTLARGVPGVDTVVNRLMVGDEERQLGDTARRLQEGDPALTSRRWEGQQVGTGKRRQGTSAEADRHADPKPALEDRWLSEREAIRNAADDVEGISAERRARRGTKARGGAPKADEAEPAS